MGRVLFETKEYTVIEKLPGEDSEALGKALYRLDKPVGGVFFLLKDKSINVDLDKTYYAVYKGSLEPAGTMEDYLYHDKKSNRTFPVKKERKGVKKAELSYEVIAYNEEEDLSFVKCKLMTGRTHQIRAQFASRKHPLAGDGKYGSRIKCPIALFLGDVEIKENPAHKISLNMPDDYPWNLFN